MRYQNTINVHQNLKYNIADNVSMRQFSKLIKQKKAITALQKKLKKLNSNNFNLI